MRKRDMPEYWVYQNLRRKCESPKHAGYSYYGARGIKFLYASFDEFIEDMGIRPAAGMSVDRIDNDGHYEKGNCRWATPKEQAANRRPRRIPPKKDPVTGKFIASGLPI